MDKLRLFKYVTYDVAEEIVSGQTLKFSNPSSFNDPFDCDIELLEFDPENISEGVQKEMDEVKQKLGIDVPMDMLLDAYRASQVDKIRRSSICCFSAKYDNITMWSHYADSHRGICLRFDFTDSSPIENIDSDDITKFPVTYGNDKKRNYLASRLEGTKMLFGTKSLDWEYEKEYRIVLFDTDELLKFKKSFLSGVIFGLHVNDEQIKRFQSICEASEFDTLQYGRMRKDGLKFKLEVLSNP